MATARAMHKPETPETAFRKAAIRYLMTRFQGHIWHMRTVAGIAVRDRLDDHFIIRGIPVQIEFKRPDGQWSTNSKRVQGQVKEIEKVIRAGGRAGFVDSWESLQALIEGIEPVQLGMLG
ncbi:MAG TPA: hypothetical protein PK250_12860 [Syntrophobacter fumaroxidans]|nr:hypothetical protein [Syntrophobacter fumaroxidans]